MESLDAPANFMDDLLDFASDIGEEEDDEDDRTKNLTLPFPLLLPTRGVKTPGIVVEEELEWISNKDAFPMVESLVDIIPNHHHNHHRSPVSVLDNATSSSAVLSLSGSFKVPVRARSKKRKRRRDLFDGKQWQCWGKENQKMGKQRSGVSKASSTIGRKCVHCQAEKTPQWRAGPMGPKTLCNACGVRYKSGRLVPEYRPASSPTFSIELHSNSHRKIVEMRRQKQVS